MPSQFRIKAAVGILVGVLQVSNMALLASAQGTLRCSMPGRENQRACSENFSMTDEGKVSGIAAPPSEGMQGSPQGPEITQFSLPSAGRLVYADYKAMEQQARDLLRRNLDFRQAVSPYRTERAFFDELVRNFDVASGFNAVIPAVPGEAANKGVVGPGVGSGLTLRQRIDLADRELRQARDIYGFLAINADLSKFKSDTYYTKPTVPEENNGGRPLCGIEVEPDLTAEAGTSEFEGNIDWCKFDARLRQAVREVAAIRMIFGQELTVDALGLNFNSTQMESSDPNIQSFVLREIRTLKLSSLQYDEAVSAIKEGLTIALGDGCFISDLYTANEWGILLRAAEGKDRAVHHMATRLSYLTGSDKSLINGKETEIALGKGPASQSYRESSMGAHVNLIANASKTISKPARGYCAKGTSPDSSFVSEMVANLLETKAQVQELNSNLNVLGFDVRSTPARAYSSLHSVGGEKGLIESAKEVANDALGFKNTVDEKNRDFDLRADTMYDKVSQTRSAYEPRILDLTGCDRAKFTNSVDYFACARGAVSKLRSCIVQWPAEWSQASYEACAGTVKSGQLRSSVDSLRRSYLSIWEIDQKARFILPSRLGVEEWRNDRVKHAIWTNGQAMAAETYAMQMLQAVQEVDTQTRTAGVNFEASAQSGGCPGTPALPVCFSAKVTGTAGLSWGFSRSEDRNGGKKAALAKEGVLREAANQMELEDVSHAVAVRNFMLDIAEMDIQQRIAMQEFNSGITQFSTIEAEVENVLTEYDRAQKWVRQSSANDPTVRLVRDSERLMLASYMEIATKLGYMAARRAEYEFGLRLAALGFRISDFYKARTPADIKYLLTKLDETIAAMTGINRQQEDYRVSVTRNVLGWTDQYLGLTGSAAEAERVRRFRAWIADPKRTITRNGKPYLVIDFSTSIAENGLFGNYIPGYDRVWLHKLAGVGSPLPANSGVAVNLLSSQPQALGFRSAILTQAGATHLRSVAGCIWEYQLVHPLTMLGKPWRRSGQDEDIVTKFVGETSESVSALIRASVNGTGGAPSPEFIGRPVSSSIWRVEVDPNVPSGSTLPPMDLQQLTDIELVFSTTRAASPAGVNPQPSACVRTDF